MAAGKGRKRQKKDPAMPKRPMSAYLFFLEKNRARLKESDPDISIVQMTSRLAEMWKKVSDDEKAACEALAKKDRDRYAAEKEAYMAAPSAGAQPSGGGKAKKGGEQPELRMPKKPHSAYICFNMEYRAAAKEKPDNSGNFTDISKEIGQKWSTMTEAHKKKYYDRAAEDTERYNRELEAFIAAGGEVPTKKKGKGAAAAEEEGDPGPGAVVAESMPVCSKKAPKPAGAAAASSSLINFNAVDMALVKEGVMSVACLDAYYEVVEALRTKRHTVSEAATAYLAGSQPDWPAFLIHVLGLTTAKRYLK